MLARRLVAGPARALVLRQMTTAAFAEGVDYSAAASPAPSAASTSAASSYRTAPRAQQLEASTSAAPLEPRAGRSAEVERLVELVSQPIAQVTQESHDVAWKAYRELTGLERAALTSEELRLVLRSVVPRYKHYWSYLYHTPKRLHYSVLSQRLASEWELRLRTVMGDLAATESVRRNDWFFVLQTLSNMGLITTTEAICRDMPAELRHHSRTTGYRLGAIVRWARNLIDTLNRPNPEQVQYAHDAFWEIFRNMNSTHINDFTLRLLLTSTAELATLLKSTGHKESLDRLSSLVNLIVQQGYGIDLDNIPMSVQQARQWQGSSDGFAPLVPKSLTAILRHLVVRGIDPHRLVSAFEVLSAKESAASSFSSRMDEDDEDDFGPVAQLSDAQEADPDRRNWLGFKVKQKGSSAFSDGSTAPSDPATPASETDVPQGRRFRLDFLPRPPPLTSIPTPPESSVPLPSPPTYNDEAIVVMLMYLREHRHVLLFTHVLETALHDAKASQAAWLPAYLSCAEEDRDKLYHPLRIAPEWFRLAVAFSAKNNGQWSRRFSIALRDALEWTQSLADIVLATESARGAVLAPSNHSGVSGGNYSGGKSDGKKRSKQKDNSKTAAATAAAAAGPGSGTGGGGVGARAGAGAGAGTGLGRPMIATPEFATDPQTLRFLLNDSVFVVSEAITGIYHDLDQLEALVSRVPGLEARREALWR